MKKMKCIRYSLYGFVILLGCFALVGLSSLPVQADGGAPNLAYIAGTAAGISVIDIAQQKVTETFALAGDPHTIYLSADGRFLYIAQPVLNQVSILAAKTGQTICAAHIAGSPSLLAFDSSTNTLFVAGNQVASVSDIDMTDCHVLHTFKTRGMVYGLAVVSLAFNGSGSQLWVSNDSEITIFGTRTYQEITSISLPDNPRYLSSPPGFWVYVTTQRGELEAIDVTSHHILPLLTGGQFGTMDFNEITGEIYVPDSQRQQLDVISPPDSGATFPPHEPVLVYHLQAAPRSVAITNDGQLGFVALGDGSVAMLDVLGRQLVATIHVGGNPHFIITGLYPPALGTTPQQASIIDTTATIAAYILVAALILVPVWFLIRQSRKQKPAKE
jgi:DNA-binding beta-propeller fold protein YncE